MAKSKGKLVLVTGGSGFIASYCIIQLLNAGYSVRTTVRTLSREADVRSMLEQGGVEPNYDLSFLCCDLAKDDGWDEAVKDCEYVLHVASPTPIKNYQHEDELIVPAREGVLRVLRAARNASVKRVVLTSAFGAIGMGHDQARRTPFTEKDWTIVDDKTPAYQKSKTLAEKAAWDFIQREGGNLELSVVNPVGVLGPILGPDFSHSIVLTKRMLEGELTFCPRISSCYIDVRDVADLHVRAMTSPTANGQRFIASTGPDLSLLDIAQVLKKNLGDAARNVPTREIPNWALRILALQNPAIKVLIPMLGKYMEASGEKAKTVLGWSPRNNERAIIDTAESLLRFGIVKESTNVSV
ncbi:MAG TPA: aldehyde reductase [Cyclobacteriaceae bacterium]|nr:aldehyde reductase [Cyclobacteriaceae bacterium]